VAETKEKTTSGTSHEDALAQEILADAHRQAEKKLERARKRARRIVRSSKSNTKEIERNASDAAQQRLDRESALILADLPHQEQIRTLRVQDEVIRSLFDDALDELAGASAEQRLDVLTRLAREAILVMAEGQFVLGLSPNDVALGAKLAARMPEAVSTESQRIVDVDAEPVPDLAGGVVVRTRDGRQVVNQSFRARLHRIERELRTRVADLIFEEEPRV
jgi:vacuolar-type H+-ATPase subunit E/Vma4